MEWVNGELHWNPILLEKLKIRWMKFWNILKMTSIQFKIDQAGTGTLVWPSALKHGFHVRSYYGMLILGVARVTPVP